MSGETPAAPTGTADADDETSMVLSDRLVEQIQAAASTARQIFVSETDEFNDYQVWDQIIMLVTACGAYAAEGHQNAAHKLALTAKACKSMESLRDIA